MKRRNFAIGLSPSHCLREDPRVILLLPQPTCTPPPSRIRSEDLRLPTGTVGGYADPRATRPLPEPSATRPSVSPGSWSYAEAILCPIYAGGSPNVQRKMQATGIVVVGLGVQRIKGDNESGPARRIRCLSKFVGLSSSRATTRATSRFNPRRPSAAWPPGSVRRDAGSCRVYRHRRCLPGSGQ
jgi:hypothetical protein